MPDHTFRELTSLAEALGLCREHIGARDTSCQVVPLSEAAGQVLAVSVQADAPLPHFPRSTMDGYAVRASDTFSASPAAPGMLELVGTVQIGHPPYLTLQAGQAVEIPTGGMLPGGADAVLMLEYAERLGGNDIQAFRPVAPGQHVQHVGEDMPEGAEALRAGMLLTSAHIACWRRWAKPR